MQRGFDSYEPDEALKQAEARGESPFVERLIGTPGSVGEFVRLAIACGLLSWLVGASVGSAVPYMQTPMGLLLAIFITLVAGPIGLMVGDRFARAFSNRVLRRIAWGFTSAAAFLLVVRLLLALALLVIFRLQGVEAESAGQASFVGAAWFTLMIALPAWGLWLCWAFMRPPTTSAVRSNKLIQLLAIALIIGVILLLGSEGAYFDSLKR